MSDQAVAHRYAQALFELALENNLLDRIEEELNQILRVAAESEEFRRMLDNQLIPAPEKRWVFDQIFAGKLHQLTENFFYVLLEKRRERFLTGIVKAYTKLADRQRNIIEAEVRSAAELSQEDKKDLEQKLSQSTGKNVRLIHKVDKGIIGGAIIKIGDKVLDGSIATRLQKMKEILMG
ncbi:F0F1 ATP synthase subunit delta [Zhaonella formicivorans]|uniref:F0F1 ATP synthase subunit delta n=1 Tax=Zhaonella formicivorans TaxID=2528593 RepID=UPI0010D1FAFF|nr:F0F1 ATP synthase subunit delta [Zhaonella formicivorans]